MVAAGLPALGMRYTKAALLIFGAGILLGLAVVAAELAGIERVASGVMALGLVLLPVGLALGYLSIRLFKLSMRLALPRPADFTKKVKKGVGREVRTWRKGFRKHVTR